METQAGINTQDIIERLAQLQSDMSYIKEYIEDIKLTEDDLDSLKKSEEELNEGKTISLEELKRELKI